MWVGGEEREVSFSQVWCFMCREGLSRFVFANIGVCKNESNITCVPEDAISSATVPSDPRCEWCSHTSVSLEPKWPWTLTPQARPKGDLFVNFGFFSLVENHTPCLKLHTSGTSLTAPWNLLTRDKTHRPRSCWAQEESAHRKTATLKPKSVARTSCF